MNRMVKTLGIAIVAALAMSVVASAAQATTFTAETYPAEFSGTNTAGNEVFETEAGATECDSEFTGTAGGPSSTVQAHPEYTNCSAFGFLEADVDTEGCDYLFHLNEGEPFTGSADIVCPSGQSIKISVFTCEVEVPAQAGLNTVDFANAGAAVTVTATVEDIDYVVLEDGFLCPFNGTGLKEGATYTSESPVSISDPGNDLSVE